MEMVEDKKQESLRIMEGDFNEWMELLNSFKF